MEQQNNMTYLQSQLKTAHSEGYLHDFRFLSDSDLHCPHCLSELQHAISQGFTHNFHFFQDGLLYHSLANRVYDFEDIAIVSFISCTRCATCKYFIKTTDGVLGYAIEYWDIFSK